MTTPSEEATPRTTTRTTTWLGAIVVAACVVFVFFWPRGQPVPVVHDWTSEWRSEPPVVSTIPGGLFEASTVRMVEDFYRSDSRTWWGIYIGETVSHIQVAVTYRYGVPLVDPAWEIVTRGQTSVVVAPTLRPSVPVAIDTATLRERTASGWARFDKQLNLLELRRSLSAVLEDRAHDPVRMALAREASRRTVGEFVEHWLVTRGDWQPDLFTTVKVYFTDEVDDRLREQLRLSRDLRDDDEG